MVRQVQQEFLSTLETRYTIQIKIDVLKLLEEHLRSGEEIVCDTKMNLLLMRRRRLNAILLRNALQERKNGQRNLIELNVRLTLPLAYLLHSS